MDYFYGYLNHVFLGGRFWPKKAELLHSHSDVFYCEIGFVFRFNKLLIHTCIIFQRMFYYLFSGTFSSVYLAKVLGHRSGNSEQMYAIKHIIPTSHPDRILTELNCLTTIG